jgi:hypothetical protein
MATHQLAQGLASLGRHGDSMLMHVSPEEVAGLNALGKMTGHKLHTNPDTGMPEAFDFGDFFTSLLPTLVGAALAPATGGGSLAAAMGLGKTATAALPIIGGMATGAAVAGAKGEDALMGGLMGGLGGYGGGNIGSSLANMGGAGVTTPAITSGQGVQLTANNLTAPNLSGLSGSQAASALDASANNLSSTITNSLGTGTGGAGIKLAPMMNQGLSTDVLSNVGSMASNTGIPVASNALELARAPSGLESLMSGAGTLISPGGYDAFKQAGGSAFDLAAPVGMAGLSAMQPKPIDTTEEEAKRKAEENKYKDPRTGLLNLAQASPGLRLMATGGTVNTNTSTISSGGIQDLYGTNDQTTGTQNLSKDGYGIGRLENLASQGSNAKAADTFYAMGGPIAFAKGGHQGYLDGAGDGMSDSIPATIEGKQEARLADGEFVIPADVVSHIGNGSSKAGSKQLYAMLDRIRKARTGHTKQGKEIKPHKYMPA